MPTIPRECPQSKAWAVLRRSNHFIWFDTYNVIGGVEKVLPVDFYIPGCPPRPEAILYGVAVALGLAPKKIAPVYSRQEFLSFLESGKAPEEFISLA